MSPNGSTPLVKGSWAAKPLDGSLYLESMRNTCCVAPRPFAVSNNELFIAEKYEPECSPAKVHNVEPRGPDRFTPKSPFLPRTPPWALSLGQRTRRRARPEASCGECVRNTRAKIPAVRPFGRRDGQGPRWRARLRCPMDNRSSGGCNWRIRRRARIWDPARCLSLRCGPRQRVAWHPLLQGAPPRGQIRPVDCLS